MAAARKAFEGEWSRITRAARSGLMHKLADLIQRDHLLLSSVESLDNGKSIRMAQGDISAIIECLRYYAGWADKVHGKVVDTSVGRFNYVKYEPIGVCAQIIPWNFPLGMVC